MVCSHTFKDSELEYSYIRRHKLGPHETLSLLLIMSILSVVFRSVQDIVLLGCWGENNQELASRAWRIPVVLVSILLLFGIFRFISKVFYLHRYHSELPLVLFIISGFAISFFGLDSYQVHNPSPNGEYWEGINFQFYIFSIILILKQQGARIMLTILNMVALIAYRARNAGDAACLTNGIGLMLMIIVVIIKSEKLERATFFHESAKEKNFIRILDAMPQSVILLNKNKEVVFANDFSQHLLNPNSPINRSNGAKDKIYHEFCSHFKHLKLQDLFNKSKMKPFPSSAHIEGTSTHAGDIRDLNSGHMKQETAKKEKRHQNLLKFFETKSRETPLSLDNVIEYLLTHEQLFRASPIHINPSTQETCFLTYETSMDMRYFEINITINPLQEIASLLVIIRETTLNYQISFYKNQEKMRSLALASISHEFRTPLNGSLTLLQLALQHPQIPPQISQELLAPAQGSLKMLLSLVNDILDYSQINENRFKLVFVETDLKQLVAETISVVEMLAARKGIKILYSFPTEIPPFFFTDPNRLSQILLNLLSNAVKFTIQGQICVTVELDKKDKKLIHFSVEDTGIGMKLEDMRKLFVTYTKIDLGEKKHLNIGGCGLGLSIANKLAMALGRGESDHMRAESLFGRGSKFSFTIENKGLEYTSNQQPVQEIALEHIEDEEKSESSRNSHELKEFECFVRRKTDSSFEYSSKMDELIFNTSRATCRFNPHSRRNVLTSTLKRFSMGVSSEPNPEESNVFVVDDDLFNVHALQKLLLSYGVSCKAAYDGSQIVSIIEKRFNSQNLLSEQARSLTLLERPIIIFMDNNMPIMNGIDATKVVTKLAKEYERNVVVIGVSGYTDKEHKEEMLQAGADSLITKPIQKLEVEKILKKLIPECLANR